MNEWQRFGDRSKFAIEFRSAPDPHAGQTSQPGPAASWGGFRLWLRDRNLCAHRVQGKSYTEVTWYLLPLFRWLAEHWDPLFHEHRLPETMEANSARQAYRLGLRATLGDPGYQVAPRRGLAALVAAPCLAVLSRRRPASGSVHVVEPLYQALETAVRLLSRSDEAATAEVTALRRAAECLPRRGLTSAKDGIYYGEPDRQTGLGALRFLYSTAPEKLQEKVRALATSTQFPGAEVAVSLVEMEDGELRGVALAGPDLRPIILVNTRHPKNQHESGRRFTIAHELCHVLHDRDMHVGYPWSVAPGRRPESSDGPTLSPPCC